MIFIASEFKFKRLGIGFDSGSGFLRFESTYRNSGLGLAQIGISWFTRTPLPRSGLCYWKLSWFLVYQPIIKFLSLSNVVLSTAFVKMSAQLILVSTFDTFKLPFRT